MTDELYKLPKPEPKSPSLDRLEKKKKSNAKESLRTKLLETIDDLSPKPDKTGK